MVGILRAVDYDDYTTGLCERAQLTLLKCAGPWGQRIYLAGGLVPKYLLPELPPMAKPHVGTMDIDFAVGVALFDDGPEPYATLVSNMQKAGFEQCVDTTGQKQSFRWGIGIDAKTVVVEFMTETGAEPGSIVRPRQGTGTKLGAFEVRGAGLVGRDYVESEIHGLTCSGDEAVGVIRVANLVPFVTLKSLALYERGIIKPKDAYDLVFVLGNWPGGPEAAAAATRGSCVYSHELVTEALRKLDEQFDTDRGFGPGCYSRFMFDEAVDDDDEDARLRLEGAAVVRQFLGAL